MDAPGNDGNASMPEQVKRPNTWRKMMKIDNYDIFANNTCSGTMLQCYQKSNCVFIGNLTEATELTNQRYDVALMLKCWQFLATSINSLQFI